MSLVLQFELRTRENRQANANAGSAEIIIFPGVRFERLDVASSDMSPETPTTPAKGHGLSRAAK